MLTNNVLMLSPIISIAIQIQLLSSSLGVTVNQTVQIGMHRVGLKSHIMKPNSKMQLVDNIGDFRGISGIKNILIDIDTKCWHIGHMLYSENLIMITEKLETVLNKMDIKIIFKCHITIVKTTL